MSTESSRELMFRYFDTMNTGGDLGRHMSDEVVWTTVDSGERARGPAAVTDYIRVLHARLADVHVRTFAVDDGTAVIEADCVPAGTVAPGDDAAASDRIPYAVVYDLADGRITAMRLYMQVSRLEDGGSA